MADEEQALPAIDTARLIFELRRGNEAAIAQAYRSTFANDLGRLVLAHHLMTMGVGNIIDIHATDGELYAAVGRHNAAIELAQAAGFTEAAIAVASLTDDLQGGTDDDQSYAFVPESDEDF